PRLLYRGPLRAAAAPDVLEPITSQAAGLIEPLIGRVLVQGAERMRKLPIGYIIPIASEPCPRRVGRHLAKADETAFRHPLPVRRAPRLELFACGNGVDFGCHAALYRGRQGAEYSKSTQN